MEKQALETRIQQLIQLCKQTHPAFETALVTGRINLYYLTGTMQDGLLVLKRDGSAHLFVKRSHERARMECPLDNVLPMNSYRDILDHLSGDFGVTLIEKELVPLAMLERWQRAFRMPQIMALDTLLMTLRSVKSAGELALIRRSGAMHRMLLEERVPGLLREGMTEAEFHGEVFLEMMRLGYHGVSRFNMFQTEMVVGQIGFGDSSVYPTSFDGPGGMKGMGSASPSVGSPTRRLKKGDLVFVDVGFGVEGYHSDKTQVYAFAADPAPEVVRIHEACREVQKRCADGMRAGIVPSVLYKEMMASLPPELGRGFMGLGQQARFLGHGIGLHVDEPPVIAKGFVRPLEANMVMALEPKCGIPGVGTVGVEDTYIIGPDGSECVTGGGSPILRV